MPMGKGTYGSKRGRPPKKNKGAMKPKKKNYGPRKSK
jgi:hypothetical protein|tara:strand:- start:1965 stop:2075 length:111 start_codon:yes stop_codon:yes gene_type:complete